MPSSEATAAEESAADIARKIAREKGLKPTRLTDSLKSPVWSLPFLYKPIKSTTEGHWWCMLCKKWYKQGSKQVEDRVVVKPHVGRLPIFLSQSLVVLFCDCA
jgi:hypothetical protein